VFALPAYFYVTAVPKDYWDRKSIVESLLPKCFAIVDSALFELDPALIQRVTCLIARGAVTKRVHYYTQSGLPPGLNSSMAIPVARSLG
jgi:hypothetical protein